jgi:hypothetical protein
METNDITLVWRMRQRYEVKIEHVKELFHIIEIDRIIVKVIWLCVNYVSYDRHTMGI